MTGGDRNPPPAPESSSVRRANRLAPPIRWNKASGTRSRAATARPTSRPTSIPIPMDPLALRRARVSGGSNPATAEGGQPSAASSRAGVSRTASCTASCRSATVRNAPKSCSYSPGAFEMGSTEMFDFEAPVHQVSFESRSTSAGAKSRSTSGTRVCCRRRAPQKPDDRGLGRSRRPVGGKRSGLGRRQRLCRVAVAENREELPRLPSESESEYVARAGTTNDLSLGTDRRKGQGQLSRLHHRSREEGDRHRLVSAQCIRGPRHGGQRRG